MNNDLTFFTNEPERNLYDRFGKILNKYMKSKEKDTLKLYEYAKKLRVSKELERIIALYVED